MIQDLGGTSCTTELISVGLLGSTLFYKQLLDDSHKKMSNFCRPILIRNSNIWADFGDKDSNNWLLINKVQCRMVRVDRGSLKPGEGFLEGGGFLEVGIFRGNTV